MSIFTTTEFTLTHLCFVCVVTSTLASAFPFSYVDYCITKWISMRRVHYLGDEGRTKLFFCICCKFHPRSYVWLPLSWENQRIVKRKLPFCILTEYFVLVYRYHCTLRSLWKLQAPDESRTSDKKSGLFTSFSWWKLALHKTYIPMDDFIIDRGTILQPSV